MKSYKIWTYIEEINEETDHYEDVSVPLSVGEFKTLKDAEDFRESLHDFRNILEED